jgi:hypothetical protein
MRAGTGSRPAQPGPRRRATRRPSMRGGCPVLAHLHPPRPASHRSDARLGPLLPCPTSRHRLLRDCLFRGCLLRDCLLRGRLFRGCLFRGRLLRDRLLRDRLCRHRLFRRVLCRISRAWAGRLLPRRPSPGPLVPGIRRCRTPFRCLRRCPVVPTHLRWRPVLSGCLSPWPTISSHFPGCPRTSGRQVACLTSLGRLPHLDLPGHRRLRPVISVRPRRRHSLLHFHPLRRFPPSPLEM